MTFRKIAGFVLLAAAVGLAAAQTKPKVTSLSPAPTTLLLVGNSFFYFNDSMHRYLAGMVAEGLPELRGKYRATSVTISGAGLNWHDVEAYLKPGSGMASYSFAPGNKVVFNTFDKPYEGVIMNDCSQCPIHPQLKGLFHEFAKKHSDTVAKRGAKPILFMTWAYQDAPEMTAQLAEQYTVAGNANDALVIPAGLAFARSVAKSPGLNAATIYAALYGKSPAGLKYRAELDETTAAFLKAVAWEAVREYYQ
jgi:hypothetical protein